MDIIEILGWVCTVIIVGGFLLNAAKFHWAALIVWIVGDIGWIAYDYFIDNYSHAALSTVIIAINAYGMYKRKRDSEKKPYEPENSFEYQRFLKLQKEIARLTYLKDHSPQEIERSQSAIILSSKIWLRQCYVDYFMFHSIDDLKNILNEEVVFTADDLPKEGARL